MNYLHVIEEDLGKVKHYILTTANKEIMNSAIYSVMKYGDEHTSNIPYIQQIEYYLDQMGHDCCYVNTNVHSV